MSINVNLLYAFTNLSTVFPLAELVLRINGATLNLYP